MWARLLRRAPWAALLIAMGGWLAAVAPEDKSPSADPPAGLLLIASRGMQDPRFAHSVILLVRHDQGGAFGIMINRPLGERPLAAVLAESSGKSGDNAGSETRPKGEAEIAGSIEVYLGGPVQPQFGFVIHSADYRRPETQAVTGQLAMTATRGVLRDIGHHNGPAKYLFALGYAGWGKGQLEGEVARRDWFTTTADPDLVFDSDRGTLWQTALDRRTRQL